MLSFNQVIHSTEDRWYPSRIYHSVSSIGNEKGILKGSALVGMMTVAVCTASGLSAFCLEGVVRSFIEVKKDKRRIVRLRPLGDVGGWCSLALFSLIAVKQLIDQSIKEGEIIEFKSQCRAWVQANRLNNMENQFYVKYFRQISEHLDALNARCLFSKSIVSNRLSVLEIFPDIPDAQQNSHYSSDKKLETVYRHIQVELEKKTSGMKYLSRLHQARKTIMQKERSTQIVTLIFGIVIPIIMVLNVFFSLIGEFGLGKELYVDRKELTDVGHFGEWPINALESLAASYFLHTWFVMNEGDLEITRRIYETQLKLLQNDPLLHNRLAKTGNQEMSLLTANCSYFKKPIDYQFESI